MPDRAPSFCAVPGCAKFAIGRRCLTHAITVERAKPRPNRVVRRWYFLARWRALRKDVLRSSGYECAGCHQVTETLEVDHVTPHNGDPVLFWSRANLQPLCRTCHQRKTRRGE